METENKRTLLHRKQSGKQHLATYKKELLELVNSNEDSISILSLEQTDHVLDDAKIKLNKNIFLKQTVDFNIKDEYLKYYVEKCIQVKSGRIYVYTDYSKICGLALIGSLTEFNTSFSFEAEHTGLIILLSENLEDKMILDFSEESGDLFLEIEIVGNTWGKIEMMR